MVSCCIVGSLALVASHDALWWFWLWHDEQMAVDHCCFWLILNMLVATVRQLDHLEGGLNSTSEWRQAGHYAMAR